VAVSNSRILSYISIDADGEIYAWGYNASGQLGDGTTNIRRIPTAISHPSPGENWQSVTAGQYHTLAIDTDGNLYAWGLNSYSQLGDGTLTSRLIPTAISHPSGKTWQSVTAGSNHTLAIDTVR